MSAGTGIEWTDATWQVTAGCAKVSEGCRHCYAERMAYRLSSMEREPYNRGVVRGVSQSRKGVALPTLRPQWTGVVMTIPGNIPLPLRWRKPRHIFVNSMSDLFHESVPFEFVDQVFAVMALCPQHTFQVLTKRPERMADYLLTRTAIDDSSRINTMPQWYQVITGWLEDCYGGGRIFRTESEWDLAHENAGLDASVPLKNVWLGTSIENQETADKRIPHLLRVPAAVRFLSCEPLLGAVNLEQLPDHKGNRSWSCLSNVGEHPTHWQRSGGTINWVIVGGESGPGARPMHPVWARSIRDQCAAAGVPFFFKQWGEWVPDASLEEPPNNVDYGEFHDVRPSSWVESCMCSEGHASMLRVGKKAAGRLLDGRTWDEMPATSKGGGGR